MQLSQKSKSTTNQLPLFEKNEKNFQGVFLQNIKSVFVIVMATQELYILIPTLILSFLSLIGSLYIVVSCIYMSRLNQYRMKSGGVYMRNQRRFMLSAKSTDPILNLIQHNKYSTSTTSSISDQYIEQNEIQYIEQPNIIIYYVGHMALFDVLLSFYIFLTNLPISFFHNNTNVVLLIIFQFTFVVQSFGI